MNDQCHFQGVNQEVVADFLVAVTGKKRCLTGF
jgi:hypothetical protein